MTGCMGLCLLVIVLRRLRAAGMTSWINCSRRCGRRGNVVVFKALTVPLRLMLVMMMVLMAPSTSEMTFAMMIVIVCRILTLRLLNHRGKIRFCIRSIGILKKEIRSWINLEYNRLTLAGLSNPAKQPFKYCWKMHFKPLYWKQTNRQTDVQTFLSY